jgi:hypothetical protein
MSERKEFSPSDKRKVLLWSDRHCCLCGKACGIDIEIHHIEDVANNDIDNALPICYDCHAKLHHYNTKYPMGTKYKTPELKIRREQIYERHTAHLVPPMNFELKEVYFENKRPRVRTKITHNSNLNPCQLKLSFRMYIGEKDLGLVNSPYYDGSIKWNLRPGIVVTGNCGLNSEAVEIAKTGKKRLRIEMHPIIIDRYEREHSVKPFCERWVVEPNVWFHDPTSMDEIIKSRLR